ncbi:Gfo/Idh/MocA family oxidoreductase [Ectobacillus sp. JY-23]|uniref:Gfo/Idh/MocA family protein n=1 Tax=Ectobacillus sp. JY-23 TaxID=2933872 RepID=UPI001FF5019B|nr:Gfo/Idh/MocA family oxidoreductase [Ectobacillus sp. JY-23]UOY91744.1 Gfo/Idh/MocA family oxidoreductase [Ectobacillus sp. JY-23]
MVRFGVIGTNVITERFIEESRYVEDFIVTAVYSRTSERAKEFAEKYGVETTFTDLESMATSEEIDAIYIASPNSFHAEQALIFMNHGKHVLCEKPIASNADELTKMIQAAKDNQVLLMEALKSTLLPNFQTVQEHLHKIGTVRRYVASYCKYSSRYDAYKKGTILNAFNPIFSNGALMDIGVYCIYPLVVLFGKPLRVQGNGLLLESGIDGEGSILLQYEDKEAVIMYSKITDSHAPSEIQGEKGSIIIDKIHTPEKVEIHYRSGSVEDITQYQVCHTMSYETQEFINLIKSGKLESTTNSYAHSLAVMEIMDEVRKQVGIVFPSDKK